MPVAVKIGRLPAVEDDQVPMMTDLVTKALLPPPATVNHYAGLGSWGMLGNDTVGDCVQAFSGHADYQFRSYAAGEAVVTPPTDEEALAAYSGSTGFDPNDPATDQGTVVLGPNGFMRYWHRTGIVFGGARSFAKAFVQVKLDADLLSLRQAIRYLGGVGLGINLPRAILDCDDIPYMWDSLGAIAGGHEIWVDGYQQDGGEFYFDLISWGKRCRMSEKFLRGTFEEAVSIYDPDTMDARGLNPEGFDVAQLMNAMKAIRAG